MSGFTFFSYFLFPYSLNYAYAFKRFITCKKDFVLMLVLQFYMLP